MASDTVDAARMSIARGAIRRPVAVWLAILFCLFGGLWGLANVGRLEDPPLPAPPRQVPRQPDQGGWTVTGQPSFR
ncbi:hypothetical protein SAMN05216236_14927 [Sedimentitalea nanhaiensis]|uniref:Uncharacterized protein n=1 Tax=Sedimentitalea nanhaiensis TaxID=999627 RepID=A0A1I7E875_9RHOB|nr:hypothetical protein SAMN05216236_14927 [Sedimentitalea nanhaiensis]